MDEVRKFGLKPKVVTFLNLIVAGGRNQRLDLALMAFNWAIEADEEKVGVPLTIKNALLDACAKSKDPSQAFIWFDKLFKLSSLNKSEDSEVVKPDGFTWSILLHACGKLKDCYK